MESWEIETLRNCLKNTYEVHGLANASKIWYENGDTMLSVANILEGQDCFIRTSDVIHFFEKPWKWEVDMKELLEECYEEVS